MLDELTYEERETVIERLKEIIPQLTRRQLECWALHCLGFTQEKSGEVLGITHQAISKNLGIIWDILSK